MNSAGSKAPARRERPKKNHAILFRCEDQAFRDIATLIRSVQGVDVYFTKTSTGKLIVEERRS